MGTRSIFIQVFTTTHIRRDVSPHYIAVIKHTDTYTVLDRRCFQK